MAAHSPLVVPLSAWPGELKEESGIYCLIVTGNGHSKCYVGQTKNLRGRIRQHRYPHRSRSSAISKYGVDSCLVVVIGQYPLSLLDDYERFWIKDLESLTRQSGYNILDGPSSVRGVEIPIETRKKMSYNHADVAGVKNPFWRKKHSVRTRRLMRKSKPSISLWNVALKGKPVVKIDTRTDEIVAEFSSSRRAAAAVGVRCTTMSRRCNEKRPPRKGYCWRWKDERKNTKSASVHTEGQS
jgi:group I intron endonuclease